MLWQGLREDPASAAQTVMAANAPMLLQRSMVEGNPAEGVMSAGQVAALIGQLDSCEDVIHGIVAQALPAAGTRTPWPHLLRTRYLPHPP